MRTLILSLAATLAVSLPASAQDASPAPSTASAVAAVVHVKNFVFAPESVTVAPGQSVRFVQDDETPHTVSAVDKSFDSGNLDVHQTWSHTFAEAGTYAYICAYHPYMRGRVVVKTP